MIHEFTPISFLPKIDSVWILQELYISSFRYEWVDVGVLDYNPASKLYLVKRVKINVDLQQCEIETISRQSVRSARAEMLEHPKSGGTLSVGGSRPGSASKPMSGSRPGSAFKPMSGSRPGSASKPMSGSGSNAMRPMSGSGSGSRKGSASQVVISDAVPTSETGEKVLSGRKSARLQTPPGGGGGGGVRKSPARRSKPLSGEGGVAMVEYWVPRVRVMFAAEDPRVFANRVAHAHMTRYVHTYACAIFCACDRA